MKLLNVSIHNFRSILDQSFKLKDYSLLVGSNNAGKSSVIDAIRAFYEKDGFKFKSGGDFPHTGAEDNESWVELEFSLTDDEHASLSNDYKSKANTLKVRKFLQSTEKTHDNKPVVGSIFAYKSDGNLSKEPFYGAKNVQSGKFGDLIYIPAISRVDEHAKLSGPSALRDLLTDIMTDVVEAGTAYTQFSDDVRKFSDQIRIEKTEDNRSLSGFEGELNSLLKPWDAEFKLNFPPPSAQEIIKSMLAWDLVDQFHGKNQSIDNFGSGFQRHFIYSLIQLGSRYVGKKTGKKAKDFAPDMNLVLFEEPEAFLHPPQQEILARSLKKLSVAQHWQVVCATHSAQFVSKNSADIPSLVRLRKSKGKSEAFQIDFEAWSELVDANQSISAIAAKYPNMAKNLDDDDTKPEMEMIKHFLWLNADRSSVFFANHVLLVEGATEVALINRLIGDGKIHGADGGLYILDCFGKYNIHRFMNFLSRLGVQHAVLHDEDYSKDENAELNRLIKDSRHDELTFSINIVPGNLEKMLCIQKTSSHRKPQHVLYQYERGNIDPERIAEFCALVRASIPS